MSYSSKIADLVIESAKFVGEDVKVKDFDTDLKGDIKKHYLEQSSKYLFWATLEAKARSKRDSVKSKLEALENSFKTVDKAKLYMKAKELLEASGEKVTESRIEATLFTLKDYQRGLAELNEAKVELEKANEYYFILKSVSDAFNMRKDMLMGLGALIRQEAQQSSYNSYEDNED